jgi:hypothetical protein
MVPAGEPPRPVEAKVPALTAVWIKRLRVARTLTVLGVLVDSPGAHRLSEVADAAVFPLGGFGMLGIAHPSELRADCLTSLLKPNGAGFSHDWGNDVDGRAGGQIKASVTKNWSEVVQVISEKDFDNRYSPHAEWANINHRITPDLNVRLGRGVLPNLLATEQRKVGYANTWVKPPLEIYNFVPVSGDGGFDVTYKRHIKAVTQSLIGTTGGQALRNRTVALAKRGPAGLARIPLNMAQ